MDKLSKEEIGEKANYYLSEFRKRNKFEWGKEDIEESIFYLVLYVNPLGLDLGV